MKLTVEGLEKERDFYFGQFERKQILAILIYHSNNSYTFVTITAQAN